jgi:hypothetical protein
MSQNDEQITAYFRKYRGFCPDEHRATWNSWLWITVSWPRYKPCVSRIRELPIRTWHVVIRTWLLRWRGEWRRKWQGRQFQYKIIRNIDVTTTFIKSINKFVCNADTVAATGHEYVLRKRITANRTLSELEWKFVLSKRIQQAEPLGSYLHVNSLSHHKVQYST